MSKPMDGCPLYGVIFVRWHIDSIKILKSVKQDIDYIHYFGKQLFHTLLFYSSFLEVSFTQVV